MDKEREAELLERIKHLEDTLYNSMKIQNEQWMLQSKLNKMHTDEVKAMLTLKEAMKRLAEASNEEMDDVWMILDQLIHKFKLKTKQKPAND